LLATIISFVAELFSAIEHQDLNYSRSVMRFLKNDYQFVGYVILFAIHLGRIPVGSAIFRRRPCTDAKRCFQFGFLSYFDVRKVGVDQNGNQTCVEKCVWSTRRHFRQGYECGKCHTMSLSSQISSELSIVSCTASNLTVRGSAIDQYKPGYFISYIDTSRSNYCTTCSALFRRIETITSGTIAGTKIFTTSMATFQDIFTSDLYDKAVAKIEVETAFNCTGSKSLGGKQAQMEDHMASLEQIGEVSAIESFKTDPVDSIEDTSTSLATCPATWNVKKSDGRCLYTDCYVGTSGDPNDCFNCYKKNGCHNGCGPEGGISFDGNFSRFTFGDPCCHHDFCYSSVYKKNFCDNKFLLDMIRVCARIPLSFRFVLGPMSKAVLKDACPMAAALFYSLVSTAGGSSYRKAQDLQTAYEEEDICVAKCPTTQASGGQGGTTLVIDLLRNQGQFPVRYQMVDIPDQLTIFYENNVIFDTGGLVSGGRSFNVSFKLR
jgi:hypothetical protein